MCVFCKITSGEIPIFKIYETANTLAFLDISQVTPGHTLVIPKQHYQTILNLDDDIAGELFQTVLRVAALLKEKLGVEDYNVLNNSGVLAGQEVNHFHIHVIPRYPSDGCSFAKPQKEPDFASLEALHNKITTGN